MKASHKSVVNLVDRGQTIEAEVIPLRKHTKLYLTKNTKPIKLLTQRQAEEIEDYLNSPQRRYRKIQGLNETKDVLNTLGYSKTIPENG